jgi:hypothetical protein
MLHSRRNQASPASLAMPAQMKIWLLFMSLGLYGLWTDFVPSESWSRRGLLVASFVAAVVSAYLWIGFLRGRLSGMADYRLSHKVILLTGLSMLAFAVAWSVIVRSIPDIVTRQSAEVAAESVVLRKSYQDRRRRRCDYRVSGSRLGAFPGHICVTPSVFSALPENGPMRLEGRISFFGMHVDSVLPASANKLLEPTLETNAAQQ